MLLCNLIQSRRQFANEQEDQSLRSLAGKIPKVTVGSIFAGHSLVAVDNDFDLETSIHCDYQFLASWQPLSFLLSATCLVPHIPSTS
jgi:hypothetical protein